jgi:hypothetical protein
MTTEHLGTARSFTVALYNAKLEERVSFSVPLAIAAPFANRLFREVLRDQEKTAREPWYVLTPHCVHEPSLPRSVSPAGPTSLYGTAYEAEKEPPPRVQRHPKAHIVSFAVCMLDFQTELFRGEYTVDDIFLACAETLARKWIEQGKMRIDEGPFYYAVEPNAAEVRTVPQELFPPEAYQVAGVFRLPQLTQDRERILFRKVQPPPLSERTAAYYGHSRTHGRGKRGEGLIFMHVNVYQELREGIALSAKVEDGGYLLGIPYRQSGSPENEDDSGFRWLVEMTDVVKAEGAWGRAASLLFTGETWSQISRRIDRDYADKKLVSWFHTHLFKATDDFGLSGLDQDLHRRFLTKPWQVAVLLNIDSHGEREIRCFQRGPEGDLVECTFEVFDTRPEETRS